MTESEQTVDPNMLWIIWGALLASVILYGVVANVVEISDPNTAEFTANIMRWGLAAAALGSMFFAYWIRKTMFFDKEDDPEFEGAQRAETLFTTSIISWALCESVAIYGLVLRVLTGDIALFYPFAGVSVALFILFRPRPNERLSDPDESTDADPEESASDAEW
jgi:hypothetical protein